MSRRVSEHWPQTPPAVTSTIGFKLRYLVAATALLLLVGAVFFKLTWPASYSGPISWDESQTTINLIDSGVVVDVDYEETAVHIQGGIPSLASLRSMGPRGEPFEASVVWRPYLRLPGEDEPVGVAQSVSVR